MNEYQLFHAYELVIVNWSLLTGHNQTSAIGVSEGQMVPGDIVVFDSELNLGRMNLPLGAQDVGCHGGQVSPPHGGWCLMMINIEMLINASNDNMMINDA